jgi:hypothetical protein
VSRVPQRLGERGSLKWIQIAVNKHPRALDQLILPHLPRASSLEWLSPLAADEYAEYRDDQFLRRVGLASEELGLKQFWPMRGPQWDGLARSDAGDVLLIEAKAHVAELCSPASQAGYASLERIEEALLATANALGARPLAPWRTAFYQLGNRLAHLYFLRSRGIPAWLILVNFVGDAAMNGPSTSEAWKAAYAVAWHVMGLPRRHALSPHVVEIFPSVAELEVVRSSA